MKYAGRLVVAACMGMGALPGRALAGDSPAGDERARAVAAALENENLRMRAKIESAALLEKAGRRDEAVAALRDVETIRAEGKALLATLLAPAPAAAAGTMIPLRAGAAPRAPTRAAPPRDAEERVSMRPAPYLLGGVRLVLGDRRADRLWHSGAAG